MPGCCSRTLLSLSVGLLAALPLTAQAAVDPSIAPRAMELARHGERIQATEMLGRYLATAPDDGGAWRALGWFYLLDSREWHRRGHTGDPPGALFLDFAVAALDQALRAATDSARLLRATVERDRALLGVEQGGWIATRATFAYSTVVIAPGYLREVGRNLVASCPIGGVLVTGTELEATAVWSVVLASRERGDLLLLLPLQYGEDSVYRHAMAAALEVSPALPVAEALGDAARRRPVCLTPGVPQGSAPTLPLTPVRLVRVAGVIGPIAADPLSIIELLQAELGRPNPVAAEVLAIYERAAGANPLLCTTLLLPLGVHHRASCRN